MSDSLHDRVLAAIGDHYELEGEIGRGGTAVVYRARDRRLNRVVAVKILPPELAHDQAIRARFTREAQTSAQLSHAHIVPIYDVGERDGIAWFVMALVPGGSLAAHLTREPRVPVDEVRRILAEVADALAYAHLRGVIHRDIKPDNILLDRQTGRAMVTDFGIAWAMEAGARLTATGIAVGTPTYMSPEQAVGERELDGRSDIYSTGVLGYQMLTGRVPFEAGNSMALLLKHVTERPRPIADLRPDVPRALRETVERAMLKAPEDRWPTAAAFREALLTGDSLGPVWRSETREPVRYTSPRPDGSRRVAAVSRKPLGREDRDSSVASVPRNDRNEPRPGSDDALGLVPDPAHLASLTPAQRQDLRLWHGRVSLLERVKAIRGYSLLTLLATAGGIAGFVFGVAEAPPFVFAPLVPLYMWRKLWKRGTSLREAGVRVRQMLPRPHLRIGRKRPALEQQIQKLAPPEVLESAGGAAIRRAVEDRAAILVIFDKLSKADRSRVSDLPATVRMLVDRVVHLAQSLHRLDGSIDPSLGVTLDARIAEIEAGRPSPEAERQLSLLKRQRATIDELVERRDAMARQLDSAGLTLGSLRLDLIKLRSSGLQSALSDVSSATQEARALSKEIDHALAAAAEMKNL